MWRVTAEGGGGFGFEGRSGRRDEGMGSGTPGGGRKRGGRAWMDGGRGRVGLGRFGCGGWLLGHRVRGKTARTQAALSLVRELRV